jgi:threonyl-tRNA synthetase
MTVDELKERLTGETKGKPWRRLPLAMRLSERPRFI